MYLHKITADQLDSSQTDEIIQLLVLALEKGSGLSQICNANGKELRRRLSFLFQSGLSLQTTANQPVLCVTQDNQVVGVAVIQEPGIYFPLWSQIKWLLRVSLGVSPIVAWNLLKNMSILKRYHPLNPHYYLLFLGVHPDFQGKGIARTLLDALHTLSDTHFQSTGVYLETANPNNVGFYRHFGYHIETQVNINNVTTFIMFRPKNLNKTDCF
ncbi:MAG TPA: N-acetyltransferase [Cyanophyceae cyanobacterium]